MGCVARDDHDVSFGYESGHAAFNACTPHAGAIWHRDRVDEFTAGDKRGNAFDHVINLGRIDLMQIGAAEWFFRAKYAIHAHLVITGYFDDPYRPVTYGIAGECIDERLNVGCRDVGGDGGSLTLRRNGSGQRCQQYYEVGS